MGRKILFVTTDQQSLRRASAKRVSRRAASRGPSGPARRAESGT